jgi:hypothetical protein
MDMQDATFAELVDRKATEGGLNDYQLSALIGLLPGRRVFHPKSVQRLRAGERAHLSRELVERIIVALDMTEEEADAAWALAGLTPPGTEAEDIAVIRERIVARRRRRGDRELPTQQSAASLQPASQYFTATPVALKRSCASAAGRAA